MNKEDSAEAYFVGPAKNGVLFAVSCSDGEIMIDKLPSTTSPTTANFSMKTYSDNECVVFRVENGEIAAEFCADHDALFSEAYSNVFR